PQMSAMGAEAAAYPTNRGRAEEVYLMRPDLVLAGTYDGPPVAMLARLGVPVVTLAPPTSLAETRAAIRTIGQALGRAPAAEAMLAQFDARLARLAHPAGEGAPLAATWGPNGYSAGAESLAGDVLKTAGFALLSLAGDVLKTAGFALLSERLGMAGSGTVPLETLVLADPTLIVTGRRFPGASRAEETLTHPALTHLHARRIEIPDADWACGIPQVLDARSPPSPRRARRCPQGSRDAAPRPAARCAGASGRGAGARLAAGWAGGDAAGREPRCARLGRGTAGPRPARDPGAAGGAGDHGRRQPRPVGGGVAGADRRLGLGGAGGGDRHPAGRLGAGDDGAACRTRRGTGGRRADPDAGRTRRRQLRADPRRDRRLGAGRRADGAGAESLAEPVCGL
ncbi:MAG: hypothetical protein DI635_17010, partial [Pseudoxanthomonas suwonensis]